MGPEARREVIYAYQKYVAEIMQRFGGFAAKYMILSAVRHHVKPARGRG
jgi:hypothetical protein